MKEDRNSGGSIQRSWVDRLSQALLGEPKDREQLIALLRDAQQRGLFDADAQAMIEGVLQVADMQVRDIMIPRSQMVVVNRDADPEELIAVAIESGHSRFPVIGDSRDEVVGVLLAKDLLRYSSKRDPEQFSVRELLRPVHFLPESKPIDEALAGNCDTIIVTIHADESVTVTEGMWAVAMGAAAQRSIDDRRTVELEMVDGALRAVDLVLRGVSWQGGRLYIAGSETAGAFPGYMEGAGRSAEWVRDQLLKGAARNHKK